MLLSFEKELLAKKIKYIAGVDEVGRGCLAGPMVVGAVILNSDHLREVLLNNDVSCPKNLEQYAQIKDSKKLTPKKRKELADFIKVNAISYSIEIIESTKLDEWGISKSTQIGFFNAVHNLATAPDHILTDAFAIKTLPPEVQTNIVGGDNLSITIAAASIVAKVFRDELMVSLHNNYKEYKKYAFDQHKGYGTHKHLEAIRQYGICDLHRKSFAPISEMV